MVGMASAQASCPTDNGTGGVAVLGDPNRVPSRQQAVDDGAAESVARTEAAPDLDPLGRHGPHRVPGGHEDSLGSLLDQGQLDAPVEQTPGRLLEIGGADGHRHVGQVADHHAHVLQHQLVLPARVLRRRP
jgi:hypothetical protein